MSSAPSPVPAPVSSQNDEQHAQKWRDFVAASPHGDVLQTLEWGPVKRPEWTPIPVALEKNGAFEATALVLKRPLPAGRSFFYLPRGPILDWSRPELVEAMMAKLRQLAKSHKAVFLKIDPCVPDETPGVKEVLGKLGFLESPDARGHFGGTQPRCNMKLDITGTLDDVQARFHPNWRRNIRRASRDGVTMRTGVARDDLKIFHDIYRVTAGRNQFTGRPLGYFEKMWDSLVPAGLMKLFVVEHEGQPLSSAICFLLGTQCWYVYGASSNEKRNLMPNHLMQWTMIQWGKENGCTLYDFRGVPDPTQSDIPPEGEGLVKFKTGFGAEMVRYIGEYDLPLDKTGYWAWTSARPKLVATLKKMKGRG